jgi:succinoglycan biosynthesis protein ExoA
VSAGGVQVSVLVPVLNEERYVEEAVAAMRAQRFDGGVEFLFVDGRSQDRTREILEALAAQDERIVVLDNPARRTPNALNIGLAAARGSIVVRMDAHTLYPPDYLQLGTQRLARGDVAWVSGPQVAVGRGPWSSRIALALTSPLGTGGATFRRAQRDVDVDSGFTGLWRRDTLERHRGWDEGWPINQDAELAARIRAEGGRIVCIPELAAEYVPRDSLRAFARQYWRYGQYRVKTARRHPASMRRSHVLAPGLVLAAAGALIAPRGLRRPARAAVGAYALTATVVSARLAASPPPQLAAAAARLADAGPLAPAARLTATAGRRRPAARVAETAPRGPAARLAETARLVAVFATMHGAWGAGFVAGCARFGVPAAALRRVLSVRG